MNRYFQLLKALAIVLGLFSCQNQAEKASGLQIQVRERVSNASIRGLFLVNDSIGWASGTGGTFLRMTDGQNWVADSVEGYTRLDFRDVHAFDANTALLMAAGEEGRILKTSDGGISWTEVYTRLDSGIFLDGMDFQGNVGYCFGDPMDGNFVLIRSEDQGRTWSEAAALEQVPAPLVKEAGFAASGTGILLAGERRFIATGGDTVARVLFTDTYGNWSVSDSPIRSGEGCGIFSIAEAQQSIVAVGGCYLDSTNSEANCAVSENWGVTWQSITENPPRGYRSCVAASTDMRLLVACGRTGVDHSLDNGYNWIPLSDEGYYTCALADSTGWLMGKRGKMAKLKFSSQ